MPKAKKTETGQAEPFVLKHRVAGAATLLFFGALVLPWVLGPPSDGVESQVLPQQDTPIVEVSSSEIEDELLSEIAGSEPVEEEVYISKITPFDAELSEQSKSESVSNQSPETSPKSAQTAESNTQAATTKERLESERIAKQKAQQQAKSKQDAAAKNEAEEKRRLAAVAAQKQSKVEADLAAALAAEKIVETSTLNPAKSNAGDAGATSNNSSVAKVERGYVVQVGVYVNKQGADRVVQDLRSKGFSPSTTVVDTNRGKKTATRVWLGPFAQRVDAGKAKSRFAELTGQGSLIREYP